MNALPSRFIPVGSKREHDLIQTVAELYKERVAMYARVLEYFKREVLKEQ